MTQKTARARDLPLHYFPQVGYIDYGQKFILLAVRTDEIKLPVMQKTKTSKSIYRPTLKILTKNNSDNTLHFENFDTQKGGLPLNHCELICEDVPWDGTSTDFSFIFTIDGRYINYKTNGDGNIDMVLLNKNNNPFHILKTENTSCLYIDQIFKLKTSKSTDIPANLLFITHDKINPQNTKKDYIDNYNLVLYQISPSFKYDGTPADEALNISTFYGFLNSASVEDNNFLYLQKALVDIGYASIRKCMTGTACGDNDCYGFSKNNKECNVTLDGKGYSMGDTLMQTHGDILYGTMGLVLGVFGIVCFLFYMISDFNIFNRFRNLIIDMEFKREDFFKGILEGRIIRLALGVLIIVCFSLSVGFLGHAVLS